MYIIKINIIEKLPKNLRMIWLSQWKQCKEKIMKHFKDARKNVLT